MKKGFKTLLACALLAALAMSSCVVTPIPASMKLTNNNISTIYHVYIAAAGSTAWGTNLLDSTIPYQNSRTFANIAPGTYDIKVTKQDDSLITVVPSQVFTAGQSTDVNIP